MLGLRWDIPWTSYSQLSTVRFLKGKWPVGSRGGFVLCSHHTALSSYSIIKGSRTYQSQDLQMSLSSCTLCSSLKHLAVPLGCLSACNRADRIWQLLISSFYFLWSVLKTYSLFKTTEGSRNHQLSQNYFLGKSIHWLWSLLVEINADLL